MKKLKKLTGILFVGVLVLGLVGCGSKTPTDVVNEYFSGIKAGDNAEVSELLSQNVNKVEKSQDKEEKSESEKIMIDMMKKMDAKVDSEKIDGENATVNVTVKGPNISQMIVKVFSKGMSLAFQGKELTNEDLDKMLQEEMKNPKIDERSGEIHLEKVDEEWKIKIDKDLTTVLLGQAEMPKK